MDKTAGHMMGPMGLMDDDAKMLCKVLEISAAQALSLKKKIKMGHKLPSWAEYKIYKAGDALTSAMASTHSMRDHMPKITISIKSGPSLGSVLPSNMSKSAMMGNSQFTQQTLKGSGLPGYSKGGAVKKDGYLTDKKGKPYARVHRGEKVVPKDEKADGTAKDKTASDTGDYARHSALNFGQAARDVRWLLEHPGADKVAPEGSLKHKASSLSLRLPSLASNVYYGVLPPLLHHTREELADSKDKSLRTMFREGYNPWGDEKTAGHEKTKKAWATLSKGK